MAGSSRRLAASTRMKDYVIDLNIYRYVVIAHIMYLCRVCIENSYRNMKFIKPLTFKPPSYVNFDDNDDISPLLDFYCSMNVCNPFTRCRNLAFITTEYQINKPRLLEYLNNIFEVWFGEPEDPVCESCGFFHPVPFVKPDTMFQVLETFPFINMETLKKICKCYFYNKRLDY